jgi:Arc-like DNA binding domain
MVGGDFDMARKPDDLHPTMVRLPETLRRDLDRWADLHGRSLNAEIIYRLEQSLADDKGGRSLSDRLDQIEKNLDFFGGIMKAQHKVAEDAQKVAREALDALNKFREEKERPSGTTTSTIIQSGEKK